MLYQKELLQDFSSSNKFAFYCKELLQCSVFETRFHSKSILGIKMLVFTRKHDSSTTLYQKVLLCPSRNYQSRTNLLHSTTPALLCTTMSCSIVTPSNILNSDYRVRLHYYPHVWPASRGKVNLHCAEQHLKHHRMLRLPRTTILMVVPHDIWNVIYNTPSHTSQPPPSPNTAPATKIKFRYWSFL